VVGLKPTYGRVSRYGLIAFGSSFDQIGPLTKTVEDAAILTTSQRHDPKDSTSAPGGVSGFYAGAKRDVKGMRIGFRGIFYRRDRPEVEKSVRQAADIYKNWERRSRPSVFRITEYSVAVYYIVAVAEASSNLGPF